MTSSRRKPFRRVLLLIAVLLGLAAALLLWRFDPVDNRWFPKCVLHSQTGLHCPGCGTTRALRAVVQGRIWDAFRYNPLLIAGGPIIAALIFWQRRRERVSGVVTPRLTWALFAVVAIYFVARNVPSPTRSWLAPTPSASVEADRVN